MKSQILKRCVTGRNWYSNTNIPATNTNIQIYKHIVSNSKYASKGRCLTWRQRQSALVQITMTLNFAPPCDLHNCAELHTAPQQVQF